MSSLDTLVNTVWPDFPGDRKVSGTPDPVVWYKINKANKCLYVPTYYLLRKMPHEIDRFTESVQSFAVSDLDASEYDWNNLKLTHYSDLEYEEALDCIRDIYENYEGKYVSCDIETRRVEWMDNKVLALGFGLSEDTAVTFDATLFKRPGFIEWLQRLFHSKIKFIWQNGKFDCTRLKWLLGIDANIDEDVMLQHYACINEKKGTHGLKQLGQLYLQAPAWEDELDQLKKAWCAKNKVKLAEFMYDQIPLSILIPYLHRDLIVTYRLHFKFKKLARPGSEFIYRKIVDAASGPYKRVELNGMHIDMEYLEDLEYELDKELAVAKKVFDEVATEFWKPVRYMIESGAKSSPKSFNMKSPKQLKWMLETTLGVRIPNTNAETIMGLLEEAGLLEDTDVEEDKAKLDYGVGDESGMDSEFKSVEFLKAIQVVRKLSKYMDTYVQGTRDKVCNDSRLRGTFNLHGTETGRLSSSGPNLQNIPRNKRIKNLFTAAPGYRLVQLDYSQAELRVLAVLSGDPFMKQAYLDGADFHSRVAEKMFGPDFNKEQRNQAKTINFGIAFGRGPSSLAKDFKIHMAQARKLINDWYLPMPKVKEYIQGRRGMPLKGLPCVSLFGRERHFVITEEKLNHIQNEYINTPIQSVASDLTLFSLMELDEYLCRTHLDAKIIASVHDSIILEIVDDMEIIRMIAAKGQEIMASVPCKYIENCEVPFKADVEIGYAWGELSPLEEVI